MTSASVKTAFEIAESAAKIAALIVGGCWTYLLFIKKRSDYPRATVTHDCALIPLNHDRALLRVTITLKNTGDVLMTIGSARVEVQRLSPFTDPASPGLGYAGNAASLEYPWPDIGSASPAFVSPLEIEPGESDALHMDFIVDPATAAVQVYSYVKNLKKRQREIGWNCTSVHTFAAPPSKEPMLE